MKFSPTPNGTYGKRQPTQKGVEGFVTGWLLRQARKPTVGTRNGTAVLALTTIGAKTGAERTSPVGYIPDGDAWIITATAAGAKNHPAWYYNLATNPDQVVIVVAGERILVTATQLEGEERAQKWAEVMERASPIARSTIDRYRRSTDREFPLIRLTRRA